MAKTSSGQLLPQLHFKCGMLPEFIRVERHYKQNRESELLHRLHPFPTDICVRCVNRAGRNRIGWHGALPESRLVCAHSANSFQPSGKVTTGGGSHIPRCSEFST